MEFLELRTKNELLASYPVMIDFCPDLSQNEYLDYIQEMINEAHRLFSLKINGKIVSVATVSIRTDLSNGRHLWISELVTSSVERSKGYGKVMMNYLKEFAVKQNCKKIILFSGLARHQAHHFWENHMGFEKRGFVFKLDM
ncbi:GNAT family N-acetyltransferase [Paenactinomyces guangxiensis]|uniref:GNAT family N-acetyltransferase n=1 Tax=Paenactinomyces guangxiensis TaxID=1490290 RepID=A0A7W1WTM8_9BACL|nr:GNAT family N-acetyltransferase [Paenactinomyces guangxiensis]MBA4495779.1 GNAT family N-acetyltransferase [Paenactinomyces guangxiensis]MBH8592869.1 GNAT family N-acetyltransferase [Paenactinomyces guangxiensis]